MGQVFEGGSSEVVNPRDLQYGELGEVVDSAFKGVVVTNTFKGIVAVYCPKHTLADAFATTWSDPSFNVRRLGPGERVILSNNPS
jgi:hypothetical protein